MSDPGSLACSNGPSCSTSPQLKLYQTLIFATPILFSMALLLLFCLLYLRRQRIARINTQIRAQFFTNGFFSAVRLQNFTDLPLEQGLSKSIRKQLPVVPFDEEFSKCREDTQCPVCLGDYQANEKLQQLPLCGHTFHVECIDEWLAKNITCPICRTSLLQEGKLVSHQFPNIQPPSRRWANQVLNEHHQGSFNTNQAQPHLGETSNSTIDAIMRINSEHTINIDRS